MVEKREYHLPLVPTKGQMETIRELPWDTGKTVSISPRGVSVKEREIHIPDIGDIEHRNPTNPVAGAIERVELSPLGKEYRATIVCEYRSLPALPLGEEQGISVSDGRCALNENNELVAGDGYQERGLEQFHCLQKELVTLPCGSKDWHKQKLRVVRQQKRLQEERNRDREILLKEKQKSEIIYIGFTPNLEMIESVACGRKG